MAESTSAKVKIIVNILKQITSINIVSDFLKKRGLTYSASSWDELIEKRILPSLKGDRPKLVLDDLIELLKECEESGKQHTFLYKTSSKTALELMDKNRILNVLEQWKLIHILDTTDIIVDPGSLKLCDVRHENANTSLILKLMETKVSYKAMDQEVQGDVLTKSYKIIKERAVNVIKLHSDGLLEIRIGSHRSHGGYLDDVRVLSKFVDDFIPMEHFREISLSKFKNNLWDNRSKYQDTVRYTHSTLRNDIGTTLQASTGNLKDDLSSDKGVLSSLDKFMEEDAYCDSSNIWFKMQDSGYPSKDIHVLITKELNEFAVPAHCTKTDYEYVLSEIRRINR